MRVGLAQINSTLGFFAGNSKKIIEMSQRASDRRCDLVVFPELSLFGYHPGDLLERVDVVEAQLKELKKIQRALPPKLVSLFGMVIRNPQKTGKPYINVAVALEKNKKPKFFAKELHPTYDVFDDYRHFEIGAVEKNSLKVKGQKVLVTICEDIWAWQSEKNPSKHQRNPLKKLKGKKFDLVVNLSASPYTETKRKNRQFVTEQTAKFFKAPMVYVNMVGAQDELIFDGGSFAIDKKGQKLAQSVYFEEELNVVDFAKKEGDIRTDRRSVATETRRALVLGIRDFVEKTGFKKVHLGLSGGIDSAVVACLAVDALGGQKVTGIALPGPYNADESLALACQLAENLHCGFLQADINPGYEQLVKTVENSFGTTDFGLVQENLQARIRAVLLMAYSNKENSLLLTTGNKSEYAMGYTTLYGDMCGGLAPIADLVKSRVYQLAELYNEQLELIPSRIITRPPSAELRPNQTDQDSLPEYADLDRAVVKMVEKYGRPRGEIEKRVLRSMMRTEFKRWQAPPILKVTDHSFGRGRRLPIAHSAY